jgi:hypothetical protein
VIELPALLEDRTHAGQRAATESPVPLAEGADVGESVGNVGDALIFAVSLESELALAGRLATHADVVRVGAPAIVPLARNAIANFGIGCDITCTTNQHHDHHQFAHSAIVSHEPAQCKYFPTDLAPLNPLRALAGRTGRDLFSSELA